MVDPERGVGIAAEKVLAFQELDLAGLEDEAASVLRARFAGRVRTGSLAVLLDPDVAQVFQDAESVNTVLRALMTTMPDRRVRETR